MAEPDGGGGTGDGPGDGPVDGLGAAGPGERALLDAFDRLAPQGSLRWAFDDAVARMADPRSNVLPPWRGLPERLWERGRAARLSQRMAGDVVTELAGFLAEDSRTVAEAVASVETAALDALRFLAARVERLEALAQPVDPELVEQQVVPVDGGEWSGEVGTWLAGPDPERVVLVGEAGAGELVAALAGAGHRVRGVEPRGRWVWAAAGSHEGADEGEDEGEDPLRRATLVMGEVAEEVAATPTGSLAGVLLAGAVDRDPLGAKVALVADALRATRAGGRVVVLATDLAAWEADRSWPARDLVPGRPLHPETWTLLLGRLGAGRVEWHRPATGSVHALVATVGAEP